MMVWELVSGDRYSMPLPGLDCLRFFVISFMRLEGTLTLLQGKNIVDYILYMVYDFVIAATSNDYILLIVNQRVGVGAVSGGIAAYISCPAEVAVVRMSNDATLPANERRNYKGVFDTAQRIIKEEGVSAFWRGSAPFVQRAMMVGVFQVATLDQFKELYVRQFNQKPGSIPNVFCAAMTSGLLYSIATMPLEAAKNRMASQKPDAETGKLPYRGTVQTIKAVSEKEGFFALYNGFAPYYARCGGHTVGMFVIVQMMRDFYQTRH